MNPDLFPTARRSFLKRAAGAGVISVLPPLKTAAAEPLSLVAAPAEADLVMGQGPRTRVWSYNGQIPGPLLRYRQGERLLVDVENRLELPTTVHWHGLRLPVAMDGVPYLSQEPIPPGGRFRYEFDLQDAGTFWYHPHFASSEQVGRGLRGVLIVDEADPPAVDRDLLWVLDDWRLDQQAQIAPFGQMHDASHAGRVGNVVTINGTIDERFAVYPGERIRLRLVNVANARIFALRFDGLETWLAALDSHPVAPRLLGDERVVLGPGQRADLIIDIGAVPGDGLAVIDDAYGANYAYELMRLHADGEASVPPDAGLGTPPARLPANPVPEPDLANAERHEIVFEGGAMGGLRGALLKGDFKDMRELAGLGKLWAINGMMTDDLYADPPLLALTRGRTYVFALENRTAFPHPIHLHGHSFRVLSRNGQALADAPIRDTALLYPDDLQEIAFVADNPGSWMFHCHILEHQETAMMTVISVA